MIKLTTSQIRDLTNNHYKSGLRRHGEILERILVDFPKTPRNTISTQVSVALKQIRDDEIRTHGLTQSQSKVDVDFLHLVKLALAEYEAEVESTNLKPMAKQTYLLHARNFVRWMGGDFEPGHRL
ncbi:MAG: hypothetical protein QE269_08825 [Fimbriimonas sp.]|jgi:hypothetical protein|nr:hypothetical protein [Fimbriimonas sp.]